MVRQGGKEVRDGCCFSHIEGGKWGLIDSTGKIVVPLDYTDIGRSDTCILLFFKKNQAYAVYRDRHQLYVTRRPEADRTGAVKH